MIFLECSARRLTKLVLIGHTTRAPLREEILNRDGDAAHGSFHKGIVAQILSK